MPIILRLDRIMADRKISLNELSELNKIHLSMNKTNQTSLYYALQDEF